MTQQYAVLHAQGLLLLSGQGVTASPVAASHLALCSLMKLTRKLRIRLKEMGDTAMKLGDKITLLTEGTKLYIHVHVHVHVFTQQALHVLPTIV